MVLKVIHYYKAPGNIGFDENHFKQSVLTIVTSSTFFLCSSIVVWELDRSKLYICEIYSKFNDENYQRSYVSQILEDDSKVFHDWINCEILVPGYLIPGSTRVDRNYLSLEIKGGFLETTRFKTTLEEISPRNVLIINNTATSNEGGF